MSLKDVSPIGFQSWMYWGLIYQVQILNDWVSLWGSLLKEKFKFVSSLKIWFTIPGKACGLVSPTCFNVGFFLIHIMSKSCSAGLEFLLRGNYSM